MYKKSSNPSAVVPIDKYKDPNYDPFADDEFIADIRQTRDYGKRTGKYFDPSKWARNSDGFYEYQKDSQESIKDSKVRKNRFSNDSQNSEEEQSSGSESVMMRKDKPLIRPEYKYKPGKQTQRRLSRKSDFDISIDLDAIDSYHSSQQEKQKERETQKNEEKQQRKSVQQAVPTKSLSSGNQNSKQKKLVQQNLEHVQILPKLRLSQKRMVYKNQVEEMKQIKKEVERLSKKKDNYYKEDEEKENQVRKDEIQKSPFQQKENRKEVSKKKEKNINELKRLSVGRKSGGRSSERRNHEEDVQIEYKKDYQQVTLQNRSPNDVKKTKPQTNKSQQKSKQSLEKNKKTLKITSRDKPLQVQKKQLNQPFQQSKKQMRLQSKQMTNIQRGKNQSKQKRSTKVAQQEKQQKVSKPEELKKSIKQSKGQQMPKQSIFNRKKTGTNELQQKNRQKDQESFHFSQSISSILSRSSPSYQSPNSTLQQLAYGLEVERNVSQTNTELNRAQIEQSSSINNLFSKKNGDENVKKKNKRKSKEPLEGQVKKSFSQLTSEEKEERYARLLRKDKSFLTQSITKAAMKYHEDQLKQAKQRRKKQDKQFMQNMRKKRGREFQKVSTNDILDQEKLEKLQSKKVQSQDKQVGQNMQGFKKQKINVNPREDNREKKNKEKCMEKQKKERQNKSPKQPKMEKIKSKNLSKQSDNKASQKDIEKSGPLQKDDARSKTKNKNNQNDYQLATFQERIKRLSRQQEVQKQTQLANREAKANDLKKKKKQRPERVKNQPIHQQDQETHFQDDIREEYIEPPKNEKRVKWQLEEPKPIEILKRPLDMKKHKLSDEALNQSDEQKILMVADRNLNNQANRYPQRNRAPRLQFWKSQKPIYDSQRKLVGLQSKQLYRLIGFNQDTCKLEDLQMEATIPKKDRYVQIIWLKKNQLMDFNGFDEKYQELTINVKGKRASDQDKRSIEVYQDGNLRNLIVPATIQSNTGNFTVQNIGEYIVQLQFTLMRNLDEYYMP